MQIRFGLDALIGWIPGIGDAMAGTASFLIVFASWRRGARSVTLIRMIANVLLETVVGANTCRRRYFSRGVEGESAELSVADAGEEQPGYHTRRDWMFLVIILLIAIAAVGIPIGILIWILSLHPGGQILNPSDGQFYETSRPTLKIEGGHPPRFLNLRCGAGLVVMAIMPITKTLTFAALLAGFFSRGFEFVSRLPLD
jgi:hypothetical protein